MSPGTIDILTALFYQSRSLRFKNKLKIPEPPDYKSTRWVKSQLIKFINSVKKSFKKSAVQHLKKQPGCSTEAAN